MKTFILSMLFGVFTVSGAAGELIEYKFLMDF